MYAGIKDFWLKQVNQWMILLVSNCILIAALALVMLFNMLSDIISLPCCTWPDLT